MSNILYRMQLRPMEEDDTCVIDSNDLMDECIANRKKLEEKRRRDAAKHELEQMEPQYDEEGNLIEPELPEGFMDLDEVAESIEPEEPEVDYVALAQEEADRILLEAKMQADEMLAQAEGQAAAMKSHAEGEGHKEGFDKGYQEAIQKQMEFEREFNDKMQELQGEYNQKYANMESELVDVICSVVEKVFLVQFGDKKELLMHSLDNVLSNVESSKEFLIRVNEENAAFLRSKKEELQEKVGQEVTLDIVQDPLLDSSQCMIETDGGLFDSSMDVQMRNLIKDIKSLS